MTSRGTSVLRSDSAACGQLLRRQHLSAVLVIDVFKDKIDCRSMTDSVGLHVLTKQITKLLRFCCK